MLQACLVWSSEPLWPTIQTPGKTGLPDFRRFVLEELHTRGIPGRLLGRLIFEPLLDFVWGKETVSVVGEAVTYIHIWSALINVEGHWPITATNRPGSLAEKERMARALNFFIAQKLSGRLPMADPLPSQENSDASALLKVDNTRVDE